MNQKREGCTRYGPDDAVGGLKLLKKQEAVAGNALPESGT